MISRSNVPGNGACECDGKWENRSYKWIVDGIFMAYPVEYRRVISDWPRIDQRHGLQPPHVNPLPYSGIPLAGDSNSPL